MGKVNAHSQREILVIYHDKRRRSMRISEENITLKF